MLLCRQELVGQLGRAHGALLVPAGDQENNLYHKPYRESKREYKKVQQEQALLPNGRYSDEIYIFVSVQSHEKVDNANTDLEHYIKSVPDGL